MKQDIKEKWLVALRSGLYKQGRRYLYSVNTYCCLGVLGDVMGVLSKKGTCGYIVDVMNDRNTSGIPNELLEEYGLSVSTEGRLITMNDTHNFSFDEIADWIEENE